MGNIAEHAEYICDAAEHYNIPAEAIAGAILWEALENPYNWLRGQGPLIFTRPGGFSSYGILGKIHTEQGSIAEDVEDTVRQRLPEDFPSQREDQLPLEYSIYPSRVENRKHHLLTNPIVAIEHVAAIINILAKRYESEIDTQVQAEIQGIEEKPKTEEEKQHKIIEYKKWQQPSRDAILLEIKQDCSLLYTKDSCSKRALRIFWIELLMTLEK